MRIRIPGLTSNSNNILGEESDQYVILSDPTRHANQTKNNMDNEQRIILNTERNFMNFYMLFYPGMYMRFLESYEVGLWK